MYTLKLDDETRRFIGDNLLAVRFSTMPVSALSEATGISRVTLSKWITNDFRFYWLTRHVPDAVLFSHSMHTPDSRESRYLFHAQANCKRLLELRRRAASGELGAHFQSMEVERKRTEVKS